MGCTTVAPVIVPPTQVVQGGMTTCSFIDLLTNIGIVDINRANSARITMGCAVNNNFNNNPFLIVRANDSANPISVLPGTQFRLSWHSENTVSCDDGVRTLPITGSVMLTANASSSYLFHCLGVNGQTVTNSVTVIVANNQNATSSIQIISSAITPGYDFVNFEAVTSVPTKMVVVYTNQPTSTSSIKVFESPTATTTHSYKITSLLPNTTYYGRVGFVVGANDSVMSQELTFTTLSDPGLANNDLTQKVLSSAGGEGIVSIPGSNSLMTDTKVTLEAWVKPTAWNTNIGMSNTADSVIISKGNVGANIDYVLSLNNGKLVYSNNDGSIMTTSPVVPLNKWTSVAVSINESAGSISFYVNGVKISSTSEGPRGVFSHAAVINKHNLITEKVASSSASGNFDFNSLSNNANTSAGGWDGVSSSPSAQTIQSFLPPNTADNQITSNVYLGNLYPSICNASTSSVSINGNGFVGLIDDVKIWDTARTADQIKTDIATTSATSTDSTYGAYNIDTALVAHWSFDDGKATDLTLNNNNGALKGDMEILEDTSAVSPILGSDFAMNGLAVSNPETCDNNFGGDKNIDSGYEITFKGGVKETTKAGQNSTVTLETCDDPTEDLVKSVKVIGNAPPRDPSYYNTIGTIAVTIAPGLFNMKEPAVRDTFTGTAKNIISGPSAKGSSSLGADSIGRVTAWNKQDKSCMKPPDKGMGGTFMIVGAIVVAIVAVAFCPPCLAAMASVMSATITTSTVAAGITYSTGVYVAAGAVGAVVGGTVGSQINCENGSTGCY